jgi:hypothetical protein
MVGDEMMSMKTALSAAAALIAWLLAFGLFVFACFVAASDAQGALVFIFLGPVALLLFGIAWLIARLALRSHARLSRALSWSSIAGLAFVAAFFVSAFIPPLRAFPEGVIGGVAAGYKAVTGETPYAAAHKGHDVKGLIRGELARTQGARLDLSRLATARPWDRVCVFGPHTDNAAARAVLGFGNWDIETYSRIATSDAIAALVFIDGRRVSYVVEQPRAEADFAKLTRRCFARAAAVFERAAASIAPEFVPVSGQSSAK